MMNTEQDEDNGSRSRDNSARKSGSGSGKRRVAYFYDEAIPDHHFGPGHPMKPKRMGLTHELILSYDLHRRMETYRPRPASYDELTSYHAEDYISFIRRVSPSMLTNSSQDMPSPYEKGSAYSLGLGSSVIGGMSSNNAASRRNNYGITGSNDLGGNYNGAVNTAMQPNWDLSSSDQQLANRFNVGEATDCPLFDGLYDFCQLTCGASLDGARKLNEGSADICINWSGGLHHAKKSEASGFCYANDITLAILELLRFHARVLYIDIDIHHGDGVEEAFYCTDRVMTCSFHKYGDFFPGTGALNDIGSDAGTNYMVNFPLKSGLDDAAFEFIFKPVICKIIERYNPGAIVLQCGADSLAGDRLGFFDLSLEGHASCVRYVKSFNIPLLVLGGGGYTISNVARCWAYETAVLLGAEDEIPNEIPPYDRFYQFYSPSYTLHGLSLERSQPNFEASGITMMNTGSAAADKKWQPQNSREFLERFSHKILKNLDEIKGAPSVQLQEVAPSWWRASDNADAEDREARETARSREERAYNRELRALAM